MYTKADAVGKLRDAQLHILTAAARLLLVVDKEEADMHIPRINAIYTELKSIADELAGELVQDDADAAT